VSLAADAAISLAARDTGQDRAHRLRSTGRLSGPWRSGNPHVLVDRRAWKASLALAADDRLDRVGDDLTRHQRVFMPSVPIEIPSLTVMY